MDRITSMAVFVRVAELGGFAAASEEKRISATMVGKHVRALEQRLGARLIHRTTRRQHLTEVGQLYYQRCKAVLAEIETMDASAEELRGVPRGLLRVTAPASFGGRKLVPALTEFLRQYPEVEIDLVLNDRLVDLIEDGFDAAIRTGKLADSGLIARPLAPMQMAICASPAYLAKHGTPRRPDELTRHECLNFSMWSKPQQWRMHTRRGDERINVHGRLRINNGEALRQAAIAGFGVLLQSLALLEDDIGSGRLVRILADCALPSAPMHLLYLPDRRPTPKLQRFIEFVVEHFATPVPMRAQRGKSPAPQSRPSPSIAPIASGSKPPSRAKARPRSA